jgi:hypothetical protein
VAGGRKQEADTGSWFKVMEAGMEAGKDVMFVSFLSSI